MVDEKPSWLKIKPEEVEELVVKLAKEMSPEKIGLFLRDNYGIPTTKVFGKKISDILKEHKIDINPSLNLEKKSDKLKVHLASSRGDKCAKRALIINEAKIKKVKKYQFNQSL